MYMENFNIHEIKKAKESLEELIETLDKIYLFEDTMSAFEKKRVISIMCKAVTLKTIYRKFDIDLSNNIEVSDERLIECADIARQIDEEIELLTIQ